jgi:hypothetical protein
VPTLKSSARVSPAAIENAMARRNKIVRVIDLLHAERTPPGAVANLMKADE